MNSIAKLTILSAVVAVQATTLISSIAESHPPTLITCGHATQSPPHPSVHPTVDSCPAVFETAEICSTCVQLACLAISMLTIGCDCPNEPATSTTAYGCEVDCPTGCQTSYSVVTASSCESASVTTSSTDVTSGIPSGPASGSTKPSGSTPPPAASSGPVKAGTGKVGALSGGGMAVVFGAYMIL